MRKAAERIMQGLREAAAHARGAKVPGLRGAAGVAAKIAQYRDQLLLSRQITPLQVLLALE